MSDTTHYNWEAEFLDLFDRCLQRYQARDRDFTKYYSEPDMDFLRSIGYRQREFFDFVEDWALDQDPNPTQAVMVASVRRDYLMTILDGQLSDKEINPAELPPKSEAMDGIRWLPRIIAKAEAKLRGELDPDTMYGCGGDRAFLRQHDIHLADFLRVVWAADGNKDFILDYVKSR